MRKQRVLVMRIIRLKEVRLVITKNVGIHFDKVYHFDDTLSKLKGWPLVTQEMFAN